MAEEGETSTYEEVQEGFKNLLLERFSSPLILSFVLSWTIINYQFFVILVSSHNTDYKLTLFNSFFATTSYKHLLFLPLFSSFVYTFIYPFMNRIVQRFLLERKIEELSDRNRLEKTATFSYAQVNDIRLLHIRELNRKDIEITRLQNTQKDLLVEIEELKKIQTPKPTDPSDLEDNNFFSPKPELLNRELYPSEISILKSIATLENATSEVSVFPESKVIKLNSNNFSTVVLRGAISQLTRTGLITNRSAYIGFTDLGRQYWIGINDKDEPKEPQ